jgi:hypothetical protein
MSLSRCATLALLSLFLLLASTAFAQGLPDLSGGGSAIHVGGSNEPGAAVSSPRADAWSVAVRALRQVLDPAAWTWRSGADAGLTARTPAAVSSLALRGRTSARSLLLVPVGMRQP